MHHAPLAARMISVVGARPVWYVACLAKDEHCTKWHSARKRLALPEGGVQILDVDWRAIFVPALGLVEVFMRGTIMYLGILLLMRIMRRQKGALNTADMLVLLIVADAAQNGMTSRYDSITEGLFLVAVIIGWDYVVDTLAFRWPAFRRLLHEAPLLLIRNGQLMRRNMRMEILTRDDVMQQLREHGIEDIADVRACYLEPDGQFSVVRRDGAPTDKPLRTQPLY
jgi:uncharacterized membrane protein YcaP (DUF421 family)